MQGLFDFFYVCKVLLFWKSSISNWSFLFVFRKIKKVVWLYRLCWTKISFKCLFTIFTTIILHINIFHIKDTQDIYNASLCLAAGIPLQVKYQHTKPSVSSKMKNSLAISQRLLLIHGLLIISFSTLSTETSKAGLQFLTDTFWYTVDTYRFG